MCLCEAIGVYKQTDRAEVSDEPLKNDVPSGSAHSLWVSCQKISEISIH